jgi:hypothetical protein
MYLFYSLKHWWHTVFNIRYMITLIVSLYRNWYLHSTINKLYFRLLVDEVHYYRLSRYLVDSCLFYGFPVVWGSVVYLHVCIDDGLFHFRIELRVFSVDIILYIYTIKTKTITGRVGVYKQIVGLYVIDNYTFLIQMPQMGEGRQ